MIKLLIYFLIVFLIAVLIGLFAHHDPGYVLIGRGYYTVELSLTFFVIVQILGFVLFYAVLRIIINSLALPTSLQRWKSRYLRQKSHAAANKGLIQLAQGHWQKAEQTLFKSAEHTDTPLVNYLGAARAAQKLNAPHRRDKYLALAHSNKNGIDFAVELTQAELQLAHGQLEQSLATLLSLQNASPHHSQVVYLLFRLYQQLKSYDQLSALLPEVRKQKLIADEELQQAELEIYCAFLSKTAANKDIKAITKLWKSLPKNCQLNSNLIHLYASLLMTMDKHNFAENLISNALRKNWDSTLLACYGDIKSSNPVAQLQFAESLITGHEKNPLLLLTLGKLSLRCELWGKARSYLEASIGADASIDAYRELGHLLEQIGDQENAVSCFRNGLFLESTMHNKNNTKTSTEITLPQIQLRQSLANSNASE